MRRSRSFLEPLAFLIAAVSLLAPRLWAEEKSERLPRRWVEEVLEKIKPSIVVVHAGEKDADGRESATRHGLGVIIDPKGVVVLPHRLVAGGGAVEVVLSDGRRLRPMAILSDVEAEVAVLKLESDRPLPSAAFGDSDSVKVGDRVLSLHSEFREEAGIERGSIEGKARPERKGVRLYMTSVWSPPRQRDLLVNRKGEIIGVWMEERFKPDERPGAVPSDQVKAAVRRLLEKE
jgi:S1-C subfamily serine protease